jgi:methionyl-tRNA formyltransferase
VASAPLGFINVHAGLLPFYRGRNIINWALINGETEVGITAHFVDEGVDTGDIVVQRRVPVLWQDTYQEVLDKVIAALPGVVAEAVELLASGAPPRRAQAHLMGSYFTQRVPGDEWIDWGATSRQVYNKVRAIARPAPGARTLLGEREIILWRAEYDPAWPDYLGIPGQVVQRRPGQGVLVKTGDSTVLLREVQAAGGQAMIPSWPVGTRLGLDLQARLRELEARLARLEAKADGQPQTERE